MTDSPASGGDRRDDGEPRPAQSRRSFLKFAGLGAAGLAATAGAAFGVSRISASQAETPLPGDTSAPTPTASVPPRPAGPGFDHLVVVMFENRSFDNLLGWLYADEQPPGGQSFDGLRPDLANTAPDGTVVTAHRYSGPTDEVMSSPRPDPGEEYPHVNTQLFGTVDPEGNRHRKVKDMRAPYNAPPAGAAPGMDGFVQDYIDSVVADRGREPTEEEYSVIMGAFDPSMLPVTSTLARNFAVYDAWHCAAPSQTFCNRSFFHASTSHGYVTNGHRGGYEKWFADENDAPTVFNRLEDAGLDWAIYYDDVSIVPLTGFIHAPVLEEYFPTDHFRTMSRFWDDVARGTLPAYAFVEPRLVYDHNDMHPPVGPMTATDDDDGRIITGAAVSDVRAGEALLHKIYSAVRSSSTPDGSNAMNTMLLVTFDEHGGTYDHVPPPSAVVPEGLPARTEMDFAFDRLGLRVPAIAISAYTAKGHVIHDAMHHGSVISTLTRKHGLAPLNSRDATAATIDNAVTLTTPRDPRDWPSTQPAYVPPNPESRRPFDVGAADRPLSPPGVGLVGMLVAKYGAPGEAVPQTYQEAYDALQKHGDGIFGARGTATPGG